MPDPDTNLTVADVARDVEDYLLRASKLHHEDYERNRNFYVGGQDALNYITKHEREKNEHWVRRKDRLIGVNICGIIVDKIVSAEYGAPASRNFEDGALQTAFDEMFPQDQLHRSRVDTARQRAIDGTAVVHLYWDEARGRLAWKHELPEHVFPVVLGDYDKIDAVLIDRTARATGGGVRYFWDDTYPDKGDGQYQPKQGDRPASAETVARAIGKRIIEVYTPTEAGKIALRLDKKGRVESQEILDQVTTDYGCIPFSFWYGKRLVGDLLGFSALRGVVEINEAVNRELSNLDELIDYQTFSLLVVQGNALGLPTDADGRPRVDVGADSVLILQGTDGAVQYVDPNPKIAEVLDTAGKLIEFGMATGRIPMVVALPQQDHAESGISRQVQFLPLIDFITELETYDGQSERDFAARALLISQRMAGSGSMSLDAVETRMSGFRVDWSENYYPTDEITRLDVYERRRGLQLETRQAQLKREYPALDDSAIAALEAEIDNDQQADLEGSAFMLRGATGNAQTD